MTTRAGCFARRIDLVALSAVRNPISREVVKEAWRDI